MSYELPPPRACSCGAEPGTRHFEGCDVARCKSTGAQLCQCGGEHHEYHGRWYGEHDGACGPDIWSGHWPGDIEAVERGWFSYFAPPGVAGRRPWIRCGPDHPGATPDLNRVPLELKWDPATERYVDRG